MTVQMCKSAAVNVLATVLTCKLEEEEVAVLLQ